MLSEILIKVFIKNAEDVTDKKVRGNLGYLGGFVVYFFFDPRRCELVRLEILY